MDRHHLQGHDLPAREGRMHPSARQAGWEIARDRFLAAIPAAQREAIERLLRQRHLGGRGVRAWLTSLCSERSQLPTHLPRNLIQVYLDDPQAEPLYDCASCGVAIPVRPAWDMPEAPPEQVYFQECPCCGGATGLFAFWTCQEQHRRVSVAVPSTN